MSEITGPSGAPLEGRKRLTPTKAYIKAFHLFETVKCRQCGRPLSSEESMAIGFGPSCAQQVAARYVDRNPRYLGEQARKKWTQDEVKNLIRFATERRKT